MPWLYYCSIASPGSYNLIQNLRLHKNNAKDECSLSGIDHYKTCQLRGDDVIVVLEHNAQLEFLLKELKIVKAENRACSDRHTRLKTLSIAGCLALFCTSTMI